SSPSLRLNTRQRPPPLVPGCAAVDCWSIEVRGLCLRARQWLSWHFALSVECHAGRSVPHHYVIGETCTSCQEIPGRPRRPVLYWAVHGWPRNLGLPAALRLVPSDRFGRPLQCFAAYLSRALVRHSRRYQLQLGSLGGENVLIPR